MMRRPVSFLNVSPGRGGNSFQNVSPRRSVPLNMPRQASSAFTALVYADDTPITYADDTAARYDT